VEEKEEVPFPIEIGEGKGFLFAHIEGLEFCRLYYGHNELLIGLNNFLDKHITDDLAREVLSDFGDEHNEENLAEAINWIQEEHQERAKAITKYFSNNQQLFFGMMLLIGSSAGNLFAEHEAHKRYEDEAERIAVDEVERIIHIVTQTLKKSLPIRKQGHQPGDIRPPKKTEKQKEKENREREVEILKAMLRLYGGGYHKELSKLAVAKEMLGGGSSRTTVNRWLKQGIDWETLRVIARKMSSEEISEEKLNLKIVAEYKKNLYLVE
jgi:hypothetical protein